MATLVELTKYHDPKKLQPGEHPRTVTVNLERVQTIQRQSAWRDMTGNIGIECTVIWFGGRGENREQIEVMETPEEIRRMAALIDSGHTF